MKVLIVCPHYHIYTGADLVIVKLANYLTAMGIENALLSMVILPDVRKDLLGTTIMISNKKFYKKPINVPKIVMLLQEGI